MYVPMQQRRDLAANWTSVNPVLLAGQIGVETDTNSIKIGDGSTPWSSLAYITQGTVVNDKTFTTSFTSLSVVNVTHGLNKYSAVMVTDTSDDVVIGDVAYTGLDTLTLTFSAPFSGTVNCN